MTGVQLTYPVSVMPVSLRSEGLVPPPTHLPFIVAVTHLPQWDRIVTPERRLGHSEKLPEEPLWILLALTLPSGVVHHEFASPIADASTK
jgi:hypothetical protein